MRRRAIFLWILLATSPVFAHDTWITPDRFTAKRGDTVTLDMTSGMGFPALDYAIKPDRVGRSLVRLGGRTTTLVPRSAAHSLRFRLGLARDGVATIAVDLAPKSIDLTPDQVKGYLDEIGADASIRQAWTEQPEPKKWHEEYTKHAKTFVRVGRGDDSWREAAGQTMELLPESDPTTLHAGDTLRVRLIESGKPLTNFPVSLVPEGEAHPVDAKTDGDGRVTFRIEKPGRFLVRTTHVRPAAAAGNWISDFATLTLAVGN